MPRYTLKWRNSLNLAGKSNAEHLKTGKLCRRCRLSIIRLKCSEDILNFSGKGQLDYLAELVNKQLGD